MKNGMVIGTVVGNSNSSVGLAVGNGVIVGLNVGYGVVVGSTVVCAMVVIQQQLAASRIGRIIDRSMVAKRRCSNGDMLRMAL